MVGIKKIAVLGAGVMGSQLAAHFSNAGYPVLLYDLNQELAEVGLKKALEAKPPAFYHKDFARLIAPCNYEEHLDLLAECQWVIEAIAERLDWKRNLYQKIQGVLKKGSVVSSNTSGLAIRDLVAEMDENFRKHFLITHFFNPPRYMRLVEIIRGEDTLKEVVKAMVDFISRVLGKGIVYAKDTPNFIANRIGVYGMMLALKLTEEMRLSVEEVDRLTGPIMGRPKSATFRTADLVGLDTLALVAETAYHKCEDDEARDLFRIPSILAKIIERKWLGQKTGQGFYKKEGKEILSLDFETLEYKPQKKVRLDAIGVARRYTDLRKKLHSLVYNPDLAGKFAWELIINTLTYAVNRIPEISDDILNVDRAMRWGFGWQLGPFEVWDAIGVRKSVMRMEAEGKEVPQLVRDLLQAGEESFYRRDEKACRVYFDVAKKAMVPVAVPPDVIVLSDRRAASSEILKNWCASLVDIGDGVACLEFHSVVQPDFNPIDGSILGMLSESLRWIPKNGFKGLVIGHQGQHFCAGANLALILELAKLQQFDLLARVSKTFQDLTQAVKYAPFPVVAAPFNICLGGGFEITAPTDRIVALAELYCGAVEVGVGLIPGAGGNLRVLSNFIQRFPPQRHGPMVPSQKAFETIAFAKVSSSAHEAVELGYLRPQDRIVLSSDHLIAEAKKEVLNLAGNYQLPQPPEDLILPGEGGRLAMEAAIDNYRKAGTITDHDALIAKKLAYVLTGGQRADGINPVDEQYLLDIEREVFTSLAGEPKSQERMAYMLKVGKPLRN
ncbi:MAG: 3-hydroxyacyl-CoA dehydrogenase NAD-binding domain-containing protein [Candidatus Aminicenantia bacterium]